MMLATANPLTTGVAFVIYTLAVIIVGLVAARRHTTSIRGMFLADRSLGAWVAALSASASSESGWVTLGLVGWAYTSGVSAYWIIPGALFGYLFNWMILAPRIQRRTGELGAATVPDLLSRHYAERVPVLRVLLALVIFVAMILYVAAQFAAAGKSLAIAIPILDYRTGILVTVGIVFSYTVAGGFRAACWTDLLQSLLMLATLVGFPILLISSQGGIGEFISGINAVEDAGYANLMPQATGGGAAAMLGFLLGSGALGINFGYPGQPHVLVRFMALRSPKESRVGGSVAITWSLLVFAGAVTVGLGARLLAGSEAGWAATISDPEVSLLASAMHLLPGVLAGFVTAAILSAICSTADSQTVVASSCIANDAMNAKVRRMSDRSQALFSRITIAVVLMLAAAMAMPTEIQIYDYVLTYGWAILGAAVGPQVILAMLWRRSTRCGAIAGVLVGFGVAVGWKLGFNNQITIGDSVVQVYNLPLAFVASMLAHILISYISSPNTTNWPAATVKG